MKGKKKKPRPQHVPTRLLISLKDGLGPRAIMKRLDCVLIKLSGACQWRYSSILTFAEVSKQ